MIIMFPMLVSQSVSENAIPGIAKTIEAYIIVNNMSDVMDNPEVKKTGLMRGFRQIGQKWVAKEGVNLLEITDEEREKILGSGGTKGKQDVDSEIKDIEKRTTTTADEIRRKKEETTKRLQSDLKNKEEILAKHKAEIDKLEQERDKLEKRADYLQKKKREEEDRKQQLKDINRKEEEEKRKREEEELKKKESKATAKITASDYKSISLEPSFIAVEVQLPSGGTQKTFIGIKVIPYRVKSSIKLSRLILHDIQLNNFNALLISTGRKIIRWVYKIIDKWSGRLKTGKLTMSGDPRRDVIMTRTGKQGLGIIVLNKNEDIDEHFTKNIDKINRLFRLGWGNIIIADDINKQAHFCMRSFTGVCQVIPYSMMYQNLGQLKVYETLEDAKRQNNSLFKVSIRASKAFSEWKTEEKLLKYYINEDN